jgi:undecaprenol kinase/diacylglycerol kinase (ATP)
MKTKNEHTYNRKSGQGPLQKSFGYAFQGVGYFFRNERNGRLQVLIAGSVFLAGILLSITLTEWLFIFLFTALVISLEMFNSALEKLCDHISPDWHPQIKVIKDMAAGAVLWASILSLLSGLFIFIPKIMQII